MRPGTVAILFMVIVVVGMLTEVEARCEKRNCRERCRLRKCQKDKCFWGICQCYKCRHNPLTKEQPQWLTTGEDAVEEDDLVYDAINIGL